MESGIKIRPTLERRERTAVIVPALNPDPGLISILDGLVGKGYVPVVVDDGSAPAADTIWKSVPEPVKVIHHERNLGKGAALKTGIGHVLDAVPQVLVLATMDADGQHSLDDLDAVVLEAWDTPGAMVVGERSFLDDVPLRSRLGNQVARDAFRAATGLELHDTQTGLRAFGRSRAVALTGIPGQRFEYETNVLLHCATSGVSVIGVPITTIYRDEKNSCSHYRSIRDSVRIGFSLAAFAGFSFICFVLDYLLFAAAVTLFPLLPVALAAGAARAVSASANYLLNRSTVFKSSCSHAASLPRYVVLACGVLMADCALTTMFMTWLGAGALVARVLAEALMFLVSFAAQRLLVFPAARAHGGEPAWAE